MCIYCDYCVYHYKSTELVSLYTLDIGLYINIIKNIIISLYFLCCSVNGSVCRLYCVCDSVCELFGETIRNILGCGCYFVAKCYGSVEFCWRCSVGLPKNVCVLSVI